MQHIISKNSFSIPSFNFT